MGNIARRNYSTRGGKKDKEDEFFDEYCTGMTVAFN